MITSPLYLDDYGLEEDKTDRWTDLISVFPYDKMGSDLMFSIYPIQIFH